jgi:hypothetical protein
MGGFVERGVLSPFGGVGVRQLWSYPSSAPTLMCRGSQTRTDSVQRPVLAAVARARGADSAGGERSDRRVATFDDSSEPNLWQDSTHSGSGAPARDIGRSWCCACPLT